MNRRDYIKREAEGVSKRHEIEYAVNWDFDFDAIRIEDELRRMGELRRSVDEADGFNAIEDGEE